MRNLALVCVFAAPAAPAPVTVGEWNVYWAALDDVDGQAAVGASLDGAGPFDLFALIEASGDDLGMWPGWLPVAAPKFDTAMTALSGTSGHETIALLHSTDWTVTWSKAGEFEPGRPHLLALLERSDGVALWAMAVHLPHWPQTTTVPGQVIVDAVAAGVNATGRHAVPLVVLGDFNEYGECNKKGRCSAEYYRPAMKGIAPMWAGLPTLRPTVPFNTTTCCTKWHEAVEDWRHHFDHVFTSFDPGAAAQPQRIPYAYPATAKPCATAACTGADPPGGATPASQGSWHRGWRVTLDVPAAPTQSPCDQRAVIGLSATDVAS